MRDLTVDRLALPVSQRARLHQVIDEEAVAAFGGHPAGGSVGLLKVSVVLEVGHDVAKAGRGELKAAASRQRARADRLAGGDMLHDDLAQHLTGAAVEFVTMHLELLYHGCVSTPRPGAPG